MRQVCPSSSPMRILCRMAWLLSRRRLDEKECAKFLKRLQSMEGDFGVSVGLLYRIVFFFITF